MTACQMKSKFLQFSLVFSEYKEICSIYNGMNADKKERVGSEAHDGLHSEVFLLSDSQRSSVFCSGPPAYKIHFLFLTVVYNDFTF